MIDVEAGDEVIVTGGKWDRECGLGRVLRVTTSGQVVLEDGTRYMPNGWQIGGNSHIEQATDEGRARVRRQELRRDLGRRLERTRYELERMPLDALERLDEALGAGA